MLQRIQTIWLLLASFISGALFISPLYSYTSNNVEVILRANNFYPLLMIVGVMSILPLLAIFQFQYRKKQRSFAVGGMIACAGFVGVMLMKISNIRSNTAGITNDKYLIPGAMLPVIAIIFLALAIYNINKDEKLVKSMDRLR